MKSNVVVVTEPDYYYADVPAITFVGCDHMLPTIIDNLRRLEFPVTVYTTSETNTLDWITNVYHQSEYTIINCTYNSFYTGFFIDKPDVYYYNNKESYKRFNLNEINDPMDILIKWMNRWQENQDKNAVLL